MTSKYTFSNRSNGQRGPRRGHRETSHQRRRTHSRFWYWLSTKLVVHRPRLQRPYLPHHRLLLGWNSVLPAQHEVYSRLLAVLQGEAGVRWWWVDWLIDCRGGMGTECLHVCACMYVRVCACALVGWCLTVDCRNDVVCGKVLIQCRCTLVHKAGGSEEVWACFVCGEGGWLCRELA